MQVAKTETALKIEPPAAETGSTHGEEPEKETKSKKVDGLKRLRKTLMRNRSGPSVDEGAGNDTSVAAPSSLTVDAVGSPTAARQKRAGFLKPFKKNKSQDIPLSPVAGGRASGSSLQSSGRPASVSSAHEGASAASSSDAKLDSSREADKKHAKKEKKRNIVKRSVTMMVSKKGKIKHETVATLGDLSQLKTSRVYQKQQQEGLEADKAAEILCQKTTATKGLKTAPIRSSTGTDVFKQTMGPITSENLKMPLGTRTSLPAAVHSSTAVVSHPAPEFSGIRLRSSLERADSKTDLPKVENELERNRLFKSQVQQEGSNTLEESERPVDGVTDQGALSADVFNQPGEDSSETEHQQSNSLTLEVHTLDPTVFSGLDSPRSRISIGADNLLGQVLDDCEPAGSPQIRFKKLHESHQDATVKVETDTEQATNSDGQSEEAATPQVAPTSSKSEKPNCETSSVQESEAMAPVTLTETKGLKVAETTAQENQSDPVSTLTEPDQPSVAEPACADECQSEAPDKSMTVDESLPTMPAHQDVSNEKQTVARTSSAQSGGMSAGSTHSIADVTDDTAPKKKKKKGSITVTRSLSKLFSKSSSGDRPKRVRSEVVATVSTSDSVSSVQSKARSSSTSAEPESESAVEGMHKSTSRTSVASQDSQHSKSKSGKARGLFSMSRGLRESSTSNPNISEETASVGAVDDSEPTSSTSEERGGSRAPGLLDMVSLPTLETIPPSPGNDSSALAGGAVAFEAVPNVTGADGNVPVGDDIFDIEQLKRPSVTSELCRELAAASLPTPPKDDVLTADNSNSFSNATPALEDLPPAPVVGNNSAFDASCLPAPADADSEPLPPMPGIVEGGDVNADSLPSPPPQLESNVAMAAKISVSEDSLPPAPSQPASTDTAALTLDALPQPPPTDTAALTLDALPQPPPTDTAALTLDALPQPPPTDTAALTLDALPQPPPNDASPAPTSQDIGTPASMDTAALTLDALPQPPPNDASPALTSQDIVTLPPPVMPALDDSTQQALDAFPLPPSDIDAPSLLDALLCDMPPPEMPSSESLDALPQPPSGLVISNTVDECHGLDIDAPPPPVPVVSAESSCCTVDALPQPPSDFCSPIIQDAVDAAQDTSLTTADTPVGYVFPPPPPGLDG